MAGIFDLKKGAFDSSEATVLHEAYEIAIQGLRSTHTVDRALAHRLARSIVKVARSEPDCLRHDGSIDPVKLAQRAILRMLQSAAPGLGIDVEKPGKEPTFRAWLRREPESDRAVTSTASSPAKIMMKLFERTPFAKL